MPLHLPRSRLALSVAAACLGVSLLLAAAAYVATGRPPMPSAAIGGPFALVDQDGTTVTQADLAGHPFIVFFGYTHCPDVCPTTLADLTQALEALGPQDKIAALFVTVDPERDTPKVLQEYLSSFDPRIRGLTGTPAAVAAAERAYRVYARKVTSPDGSYSMDHTAVIYLMDRNGRFVSALNLDQPPQAAAKEIRQDLGGASS